MASRPQSAELLPAESGKGSAGIVAIRHSFIGSGQFIGDGGRELQRVWQLGQWRPIARCDGRFGSRDSSVAHFTLTELCALFSVDASSAIVAIRRGNAALDGVETVRFRGGGGLLSYARADGRSVHTLNTESGLARKLIALAGVRAVAASLAPPAAAVFESLCRLLEAIPDEDGQRTAKASAVCVALRFALARAHARGFSESGGDATHPTRGGGQ